MISDHLLQKVRYLSDTLKRYRCHPAEKAHTIVQVDSPGERRSQKRELLFPGFTLIEAKNRVGRLDCRAEVLGQVIDNPLAACDQFLSQRQCRVDVPISRRTKHCICCHTLFTHSFPASG